MQTPLFSPQVAAGFGSDSEEDFPAMHPEQDEPENQQHSQALDDRGEGCSEHLEDTATQVSAQCAREETRRQLPHAIELALIREAASGPWSASAGDAAAALVGRDQAGRPSSARQVPLDGTLDRTGLWNRIDGLMLARGARLPLTLGFENRSTVMASRTFRWIRLLAGMAAMAFDATGVHGGDSTVQLRCLTPSAPQYGRVDFQIDARRSHANAFDPDEVDLHLELTAPGGSRIVLPAFWGQPYERRSSSAGGRSRDGYYPSAPPAWQARFTPAQTGSYEALAVLRDRLGASTSAPVRFACVRSDRNGFVRISQRDPRFLEFDSGKPFFPIGQNLAFIGNGQRVNVSRAEDIFGRLAAEGANYLRIWACCEDWAMAIEARKSAWGRSWAWHPPFASAPGEGDSSRLWVCLSPTNNLVRVSPSHDVALRPATRYAVSFEVRTDPGSALRLEVQGQSAPDSYRSAPDQGPVAVRFEFATGPAEHWLTGMSFRLEGSGRAWFDSLSLREAAGGPELLWEAAVNRPARGFYNPVDCQMLDEVVAAAERHGIYLQICLLTRDLYMGALRDSASQDYDRAIADAKKLFRYAVARWGCSPNVAAWEYWNEMDPRLPTDRFYAELGAYLETADPYRHLRTTSTWGPSEKDCRHPQLDIADTHFYLRPADRQRLADEVEAILDRTRWLQAQAPRKPAHLGEFGLANDRWQPTEEMRSSRELIDLHNSLWASALSGASSTALFWWWERIDQRGGYRLYRPLSTFLAGIPWTGGAIEPAAIQADDRLRALGLRTRDHAWLWIFHRAAAWQKIVIDKRAPPEVRDAVLDLAGLAPGAYRVQWFDTRTAETRLEQTLDARESSLRLVAPRFTHDIAARVYPETARSTGPASRR